MSHPSLLLTKKGIIAMREARGKVPVFDASMARTLAGANAAVASEIIVPKPRDGVEAIRMSVINSTIMRWSIVVLRGK